MGRFRDFYLDRFQLYRSLLRAKLRDEEKEGYIDADRGRGSGDHDTLSPQLFEEVNGLFMKEMAWMTAALFAEAVANQVCIDHYSDFHQRFQERNKFPRTRYGVDFGAWETIAEPKKVFDMMFGSKVNKRDGFPEPWLKSALSGAVSDMKWIVFDALRKDAEVDRGIDKEEFWTKCVERFPDWLKEEALR